MAKSLLYRLFGAGKIPGSMAAPLEGEGIVLSDEGLPGSATYHNFRSPQRWSHWRREGFCGSLVLTEARITAFAFGNRVINVPFTDERIRALKCSVERDEVLCVAFDVSVFHKDWSGTIEYRFRTPHARAFLERLRERTG
jgi:hypothetical protein